MKRTGHRLALCVAASVVVQLLVLAWFGRPVSRPLSLPTLEVLLVSPKNRNQPASTGQPASPANAHQEPASESLAPQPHDHRTMSASRTLETNDETSSTDQQLLATAPSSPTQLSAPTIDLSTGLSPPQPMLEGSAMAPAASIVEPSNTGVILAIRQRLAQYQSYPASARRRGVEGAATVRFIISRRGELMNSELLKSSGSKHLDQAALRLVADAAPYPPLPGHIGAARLEVKIPIEYRLQPPAI